MIYLESLFTFLLSLLLIKGVILLSKKYQLIDNPNERSVHRIPMPTSAGIGVILSVLIIVTLFHYELVISFWYLLLSIIIVFIVGIIDDIKNIAPRYKFLGITLAILLLCYNGYYIDSLGNYFSHKVSLHWFFIFPITYFAVIGYTNALNLVDGVDGLAGSVSVVIFSTLLAIGIRFSDPLIITLSSMSIASLLAFLLFNWYPAKIFMGDSGSLTLGFLISVLSIKALEYITPTSILFIAAVPILDTVIVFYRRVQRHGSPFKADRIHLHHLILFEKQNITFTVVTLTLIQIVLSMIGYSSIHNDDFFNLIQFIIILYIFLTLFDQRHKQRQ
ncbi:MAG: MraY family glycosyltransferase [Campylobacterota bacterium]|nr:MraY family glycosyltransferase [Campylobacterota bacterium]